jgi:drug/metabolite transporter (DMT)-like permease
LRIALMLMAAICIFLDGGGRIGRKKGTVCPDRRDKRPLLILLLAVHTMASVGYSISLRYYMRMSASADSSSLFFFTNLFLMGGALLVFMVMARRHPREVRPSMDALRPLMLFLIAGSTILSNVGSLINAELVLLMDATVLTPVSSAITILAAFVPSFLVLREPCGRYTLAAAVLALATVLLPQ